MGPKNIIDLGINIDHVATLRNARGTTYPDPLKAAQLAEEYGADLITLHLREDRRHIKDADLINMRPLIKTRMNLECAVTPEMIEIACQVKPHDVCLVPEKRQEVTTEGGLDVIGNFENIKNATQRLIKENITVSIFIDPDEQQIAKAKEVGATVIELHTGKYADSNSIAQQQELIKIIKMAEFADSLGLIVNAGHGLHYHNVSAIAAIPQLHELNIGHALIAQSLFHGLAKAVSDMKQLMIQAR